MSATLERARIQESRDRTATHPTTIVDVVYDNKPVWRRKRTALTYKEVAGMVYGLRRIWIDHRAEKLRDVLNRVPNTDNPREIRNRATVQQNRTETRHRFGRAFKQYSTDIRTEVWFDGRPVWHTMTRTSPPGGIINVATPFLAERTILAQRKAQNVAGFWNRQVQAVAEAQQDAMRTGKDLNKWDKRFKRVVARYRDPQR
jgi:hypothetical protein